MFRLIRMTFWIGLVLLLLPIGTGEDDDAPSIGIVQLYMAAQSTIADLGGFCGRNPQACEMGGSIVTLVGLKAKEATRLAYAYLSDTDADEPTGVYASQISGSLQVEAIPFEDVAGGQPLPPQIEPRVEPGYAGALTAADMEIPWQLGAASSRRPLDDLGTTNSIPAFSVPVPRPNPLF